MAAAEGDGEDDEEGRMPLEAGLGLVLGAAGVAATGPGAAEEEALLSKDWDRGACPNERRAALGRGGLVGATGAAGAADEAEAAAPAFAIFAPKSPRLPLA